MKGASPEIFYVYFLWQVPLKLQLESQQAHKYPSQVKWTDLNELEGVVLWTLLVHSNKLMDYSRVFMSAY